MDYKEAIRKLRASRQTTLLMAQDTYIRALNDSEFYAVEKSLRELILRETKGETVDKSSLLATRANCLMRLKLSETDFFPPYSCPLCKDSGYNGDKVCVCIIKACSPSLTLPLTFDSFVPSSSVKQLYTKLINFCDNFPDTKRKIIVLSGGIGTGKTHLAMAVTNRILTRGDSALFISAFDFVSRALQYHTTFDESKSSYLAPLLDSDLLVIDDLGTENILRNVTLEYLYLVLNERILKNKHTFFTTNLSPDELLSRYGERIWSRLFDKSLCFKATLTCPNHRNMLK